MSSPNEPLARYYDRLARYTRLARRFGWGGGDRDAAVRRSLIGADGRASPRTTENLVAEAAGAAKAPRILDAGCGLGGLGLALLARFGGTLDGISLSPAQIERARAEAARRGLAARFRVASYDDPLDGTYDLVVAVEALAHSPDLARSLANLARGLAPGGKLIAVDDVRACPEGDPDAQAFVAGWRVPSFVDEATWRAGFAAAGLRLDRIDDLSDRLVHRDPKARARLARWNRRAHRFVPPLRALMDSHWGGLALERLHARKAARYALFAASL
ncbi:MAG: methyltransferase domain-containing protein [Tagaea sp.]|nr:methyltransferase domain-containing protein [Tagaea sp.]